MDGEERKLRVFTFTLGYSRTTMALARVGSEAGDAAAGCRRELFASLGGVPEEILYDRIRTVWLEKMSAARSSGIRCFWICALLGLHPVLCRPYPITPGQPCSLPRLHPRSWKPLERNEFRWVAHRPYHQDICRWRVF